METYRLATGDEPPGDLGGFYASYRAGLRARLSIWHLEDGEPEDPEHWRHRALHYLNLSRHYLDRMTGRDGTAGGSSFG